MSDPEDVEGKANLETHILEHIVKNKDTDVVKEILTQILPNFDSFPEEDLFCSQITCTAQNQGSNRMSVCKFPQNSDMHNTFVASSFKADQSPASQLFAGSKVIAQTHV